MKKVRIVFEADPALAHQIDEWRYANRVPSRSEAIRKLAIVAMRAGLKAYQPTGRTEDQPA